MQYFAHCFVQLRYLTESSRRIRNERSRLRGWNSLYPRWYSSDRRDLVVAGGLIIERGTSGSACKMAAIDPSQRQRNDFVTRLPFSLFLFLPIFSFCSIRSSIRLIFSHPFCLFSLSLSLLFLHISSISSSFFLSVNLAISFAHPLFPTVRLVHDLVLFSLKLRALSTSSRFERTTPRTTVRHNGGNFVATLFLRREKGSQFGREKKVRYFQWTNLVAI